MPDNAKASQIKLDTTITPHWSIYFGRFYMNRVKRALRLLGSGSFISNDHWEENKIVSLNMMQFPYAVI